MLAAVGESTLFDLRTDHCLVEIATAPLAPPWFPLAVRFCLRRHRRGPRGRRQRLARGARIGHMDPS